MPRDQRLYMTFPIDMHRHPKIERLDPAVRWTFFEMNGEARIADNDGTFLEADAEFMWPVDHLTALTNSHPSRPLVVHEDGFYKIRDYAEHQQTRAERERLAEVSRQNGRKGGRPRKNPEGTQPEPSQVSGAPLSPTLLGMASRAGITSVAAVVAQIEKHTARAVEPVHALTVALHLLAKARNPRVPQRYVIGAISRSPAEVQQFIDEGALGKEIR